MSADTDAKRQISDALVEAAEAAGAEDAERCEEALLGALSIVRQQQRAWDDSGGADASPGETTRDPTEGDT